MAPSPGPTFDSTAFKLTSFAYNDGGDIPEEYACIGGNSSAPLEWAGAPPQTAAFVLVMHDETADFTHWIAEIPFGGASGFLAPDAAHSNTNLVQSVPYESPCPPAGVKHEYVITLYALSASVVLTATSPSEVETAIKGKVLASTTLTGWFIQWQLTDRPAGVLIV